LFSTWAFRVISAGRQSLSAFKACFIKVLPSPENYKTLISKLWIFRQKIIKNTTKKTKNHNSKSRPCSFQCTSGHFGNELRWPSPCTGKCWHWGTSGPGRARCATLYVCFKTELYKKFKFTTKQTNIPTSNQHSDTKRPATVALRVQLQF